jgi:hypothetical protein
MKRAATAPDAALAWDLMAEARAALIVQAMAAPERIVAMAHFVAEHRLIGCFLGGETEKAAARAAAMLATLRQAAPDVIDAAIAEHRAREAAAANTAPHDRDHGAAPGLIDAAIVQHGASADEDDENDETPAATAPPVEPTPPSPPPPAAGRVAVARPRRMVPRSVRGWCR